MIKPNELRIGNLIHRVNDGICKVNGIVSDGFIQYQTNGKNTYGEPFESFEGIPITKLWLLKFGFRLQIGFVMLIGREFQDYSLEISHNDVDKWYCYFRNFNKGELDDFVLLRNDLKYIHQLQNLYFALTGEELTIK